MNKESKIIDDKKKNTNTVKKKLTILNWFFIISLLLWFFASILIMMASGGPGMTAEKLLGSMWFYVIQNYPLFVIVSVILSRILYFFKQYKYAVYLAWTPLYLPLIFGIIMSLMK